MAERMERLEGDVTQQREQLQRFIDYQYTCNITLGEMMRYLAVGMAVDILCQDIRNSHLQRDRVLPKLKMSVVTELQLRKMKMSFYVMIF